MCPYRISNTTSSVRSGVSCGFLTSTTLHPPPPKNCRGVPQFLQFFSFPFFVTRSYMDIIIRHESKNFPKLCEQPQRSAHHKSDTKQVQNEDLETFGPKVQNLLTRYFRPSIWDIERVIRQNIKRKPLKGRNVLQSNPLTTEAQIKE